MKSIDVQRAWTATSMFVMIRTKVSLGLVMCPCELGHLCASLTFVVHVSCMEESVDMFARA